MSESNTPAPSANPKSKENEKTENPVTKGKGTVDLAAKLRNENAEEPGSAQSSRRSSFIDISGSVQDMGKQRSKVKQSSFKEMISKDATYSKYITGEEVSTAAAVAKRKHKFKMEDPLTKAFAKPGIIPHDFHGYNNVPRPSTTSSAKPLPDGNILSNILEPKNTKKSASADMQLSKASAALTVVALPSAFFPTVPVPAIPATTGSKENEKTENPVTTGKGTVDLAAKLRNENAEEPGSSAQSSRRSSFIEISGSVQDLKKQRSKEKQSSFEEMVSKDATYSKYITGEEVGAAAAANVAKRKHKFKMEDPLTKAFVKPEQTPHDFHGYNNVPRPSTTSSAKPLPDGNILSNILEPKTTKQSASTDMQLSKAPAALTVAVPSAFFPSVPAPKIPIPTTGSSFFLEDRKFSIRPLSAIVTPFASPVPSLSAITTPAIVRKVSDHIVKKLDLVPKNLKGLYSRRPVNPPLKYAKLTQQRAKRLFGNDSRLATQQFHVILRMLRKESEAGRSQSLNSGLSYGTSLSWIKEYSETDFIVHPDYGDDMPSSLRRLATSRLFAAYAPLYYAMILTGRWPFSGGIDKKTGFLNITFNRQSSRFVTFVLTSILIFMVIVLSFTSTALSYDAFARNSTRDKIKGPHPNGSKVDTVHPYVQLEVLLLEKHWLSYTILMLTFLYGTACNAILIFNGHKTAKIFNDVVNTCITLQLDGSKYIWVGCVGSLVLPSLWLLYKVIDIYWQFTVLQEELNGYLTMSTCRFFYRYIRTNLDLYIIVAPFILIIQMYGALSFWFHVALPSIISMGINNLGQHWNFRLAVLLDKIGVTSASLKRIKSQLNYDYMLRCHLIIRELVTYYSLEAFSAILIMFYCLMVTSICCILFRIARLSGISFDRVNESEPELPNNTIEFVNIKYIDPPFLAIYNSFILLIGFVTTLVLVNEVIGRVGQTIMDKGFFHVRRHGLISCRTPHERRFLLSATNPCTIAPGRLFSVDRRFLIAILETIAIIFTTMIQARVNSLVQHEILGLCDTGICVIGYSRVRFGRVNPLAELIMEVDEIIKIVDPPAAVSVPTPVPFAPPRPPAAFTDPTLKLFQRCPRTDITRQIIYKYNSADDTYDPLPFPTESSECLFNSYPVLYDPLDTETYYDALGNPVDRATIDTCGIPSLPNIKYINREGVTEKELEALKSTISLSVQEPVYTQTGTDGLPGHIYSCQTPEVPPPDPDVAVFIVLGPPALPSFMGERPVTCGMPSLYVDSFCAARQNNWDYRTFIRDASRVDGLSLNPPRVPIPTSILCTVRDFDAEMRDLYTEANADSKIANEVGFVFKLNVPERILGVPADPSRIWLRQTMTVGLSYTGDTIPPTAPRGPDGYLYHRFATAPLKRSLKNLFLPYPYTSESDRRSGSYMYDCFGNSLGRRRYPSTFDDCGQAPFTIVRRGTTLSPDQIRVRARGNTFNCWEHQLEPDVRCGVDMRYPNSEDYILFVCLNWRRFQSIEPGGGFLNEYLDDA